MCVSQVQRYLRMRQVGAQSYNVVMFSAADDNQLRHSHQIEAYHHASESPQQQVKSSAGRAAGSPAKKLIGIRYLFASFDERTTLLDRARIWVARHDYKYFVDWTDSQLQSVDPSLRPLAPITRDVYKLHMNRFARVFGTFLLHVCNVFL